MENNQTKMATQLLDETLDLVCKLEDILNRLKVTDPRDQESIAKVHTKLVRNHRLKLLIKEITS